MFLKVNEGRTINDGKADHKPGATFEIDGEEGERLVKRGYATEVNGLVAEPGMADARDATVEEIQDAIYLLDTDNPKLWTKSSGPGLDALRDVLGPKRLVTSELRDKGWEAHKAAQK